MVLVSVDAELSHGRYRALSWEMRSSVIGDAELSHGRCRAPYKVRFNWGWCVLPTMVSNGIMGGLGLMGVVRLIEILGLIESVCLLMEILVSVEVCASWGMQCSWNMRLMKVIVHMLFKSVFFVALRNYRMQLFFYFIKAYRIAIIII